MDKNKATNIIQYGSVTSKRTTRSALAAELYAMVHGFDVASTIRWALNDMLDYIIPLHVYTDSHSLWTSMFGVIYLQTQRASSTQSRLLNVCMSYDLWMKLVTLGQWDYERRLDPLAD